MLTSHLYPEEEELGGPPVGRTGLGTPGDQPALLGQVLAALGLGSPRSLSRDWDGNSLGSWTVLFITFPQSELALDSTGNTFSVGWEGSEFKLF